MGEFYKMDDWIIKIIDSSGYVGIMLLIALENIFPPIPSEVILTLSGFMTNYTRMNIWIAAVFATIGSSIGAIIIYSLGRLVNTKSLERWINKWGHIFHLKIGDVKKAKGWFVRHGNITVFFCRFIPIVRSLISLPAGMAKMNVWIFLLYTGIGTFIWNSVLIFLGAFAGSQWKELVNQINMYSYIILGCVAVGVIFAFWAIKKIKNRS